MRLNLFFLIFVSVLVSSVHASDEKQSSSLNHAIDKGKATFNHFCAVCHGKDGRGSEQNLYKLKKRPPDLTMLASKNNGEFPWLRVFKVINSQESINAHEFSEMPEWGTIFDLRNWGDEENDEFAEEIVYGRLFVLLMYLDSIQETNNSE